MPGKSDDAKMAKLIRQNMAKAEQKKPKDKRRQQYDPTLGQDVDDDPERRAFFSEMKKREF
jgi:hypothetical protein